MSEFQGGLIAILAAVVILVAMYYILMFIEKGKDERTHR